MTAAQSLSSNSDNGNRWEDAPAPAQVAKRLVEGLFHRQMSPDTIPLLTQTMHWSYGIGWGSIYAVLEESLHRRNASHGLVFGSAVWLTSYALLVPMGIYKPPWHYSPSEVASDLSYHLVYGAGVGAAYEAIADHPRG